MKANISDSRMNFRGLTFSLAAICMLSVIMLSPVAANAADFVCGDANADGRVNVGDPIVIISYIFKCGEYDKCGYPLKIPEAGDPNCDSKINIGDAVYVMNYIFRQGPPPCCPPTGKLVTHSSCKSIDKAFDIQMLLLTQDCIQYSYDGQTLSLTHINAGLNCAADFSAAKVKVKSGVITIDETLITGNANCLCLFDLDYQVVDLKPGQYQIVVSEQNLQVGDAPLQTSIDLTTAPSGSFCVDRTHYPW
jgi:hypothetical protein